jgi:hypothetical protein
VLGYKAGIRTRPLPALRHAATKRYDPVKAVVQRSMVNAIMVNLESPVSNTSISVNKTSFLADFRTSKTPLNIIAKAQLTGKRRISASRTHFHRRNTNT